MSNSQDPKRKIIETPGAFNKSTYSRDVGIHAAGVRRERRLEISLELQEHRQSISAARSVLFVRSYSAVIAELAELSENQADPVYDDDDILGAIDSESMFCGRCIAIK